MNSELEKIIHRLRSEPDFLSKNPFLRPIAQKVADLAKGCVPCHKKRKEQELEDQFSVTKSTTPKELWDLM